MPLQWILDRIGLSRSLYYRWCRRRCQNRLDDQVAEPTELYRVLPEEEDAVVDFANTHLRDGYRRLAWMMVDEDVVYLSPSSVYRILDRRDLLCRWKPSQSSARQVPKPTQPHEQWHTDLMYLWVNGRWFFFVGVLDSFSRYIVHWDLLTSMRATEVTDVVHAALEKHPGHHPRIVHDNGGQFTGKDFRKLVKRFSLKQIRIRVHHPESNGRIERFHRSLRQEGLAEHSPQNLYEAHDIIAAWIDEYNNRRLHAGLAYLTPCDWLHDQQQSRLAERQDKLAQARRRRYRENLKRRHNTIDCQRTNGGSAPIPPGFFAFGETGSRSFCDPTGPRDGRQNPTVS